jgi:hypothetical protein
VVFVGRGERPRLGGEAVEEARLGAGARIEWGTSVLRYEPESQGAAAAPIEEISLGSSELLARTAAPAGSESDDRLLRRLRAGLLVDLGLAERAAVRRWQESVLAGEFDADRCAEELLQRSSAPLGDARLLERSGRLLRDFLMAPLGRGLRGAGRRTRQAVRGGVAYLVAQGTALLVYTLIVLIALLVLRSGGLSLDGLLDRLLPW